MEKLKNVCMLLVVQILGVILLVEFREIDIKCLRRFYLYLMEVENRFPARNKLNSDPNELIVLYSLLAIACYMGREWELSSRLDMRPWIVVAYSAIVAT